VRSIVAGILVVVVMVVLVCSASSLVKWAGSTLLILPRAFGLLGAVYTQEIVTLPLDQSPTGVTFPRAERYAVYTSDLDLLEVTASLDHSQAPPWLVIQRETTGQSVPVTYIRRGLMPYDDPRAPGRPVLMFAIDEPGTYALSHPRRNLTVSLVPDRTTGREGLIAAAAVVQLALLAAPVAILLGRPWLERRRSWREHQRQRRAASDAVVRRRAARRP
jgi:hypothetical protein